MFYLKISRDLSYNSFIDTENVFNKIDEIIRCKIKSNRYKISRKGNADYKAEVFFDNSSFDSCRLLAIELAMTISSDSTGFYNLLNSSCPIHTSFKGIMIEVIQIPDIRKIKFEIAIDFKKPISIMNINGIDNMYAKTDRVFLMIDNYFTHKNELADYIKNEIYNFFSKIDGCYDHFYYNNKIVSSAMYEFGRDDSPQLIDIRKDAIDPDSNIDHVTIRIFEC